MMKDTLTNLKRLAGDVEKHASMKDVLTVKDDLQSIVSNLVLKVDAGDKGSATVNMGTVFKEEITHLTSTILDNLNQVKKMTLVLAERLASDSPDARKLPGMMDASISKIQRELSIFAKRTPDQAMDAQDIYKIVEKSIPGIHDILDKQFTICSTLREHALAMVEAVNAIDVAELDKAGEATTPLQAEITTLKADLARMKATTKELQATIESRDGEIASLAARQAGEEETTKRMAELQAANDALKADLARMEATTKELQATIEKRDGEIASLSACQAGEEETAKRVAELQAANDALKADLARMEATTKELQATIESRDGEIASLSARQAGEEETAKRVAELQAANDALKADLTRMEATTKELQTTIEKRDGEIASLSACQAGEEETAKRVAELQAEIEVLKAEIERLKAEIERLKSDLEDKNAMIQAMTASIDQKERDLAALASRPAVPAGPDEATTRRLAMLEAEVKVMMDHLENSPRFQVLFAITNASPIQRAGLKRVAPLNDALLNKILSDLQADGLITVTGTGDDATITAVKKLNPIGGIPIPDVKTLTILDKLKAHEGDMDNAIDTVNDQVERYMRENQAEVAGYIVAASLVNAIAHGKPAHVQAILSRSGDVTGKSFYSRLVMNMIHAYTENARSHLVKEGIDAVPRLEVLDASLARCDVAQLGDGPFTIDAIEQLEPFPSTGTIPVATDPDQTFGSIDEVAAHGWVACNGTPFKARVKGKDGKTRELVIVKERPEEIEVFKVKYKEG